jgi:hypothetical protein
MDAADILRIRLRAQLVESGSATSPHDVVSRLLGMQAQDYLGSLWALGLRLPGSAVADIEDAIARRSIVRTWPMRGTLHFVTAEDVRWLLPLLAPRVLAGAAGRERQLELDSATFGRSRELFSAALVGGRRLSRPAAMAMLEAGGVATGGQRGYHILWRLAQEGLLVLGPVEDKQQTFALLDEWLPDAHADASASQEELLARLAERYFLGHGPATVDDLARWADIPKSAAKGALACVSDRLETADHEGARYWFAPENSPTALPGTAAPTDSPVVHLLPGFDEYMIGYTGRSHQLGEHLATYGSQVASNGMLAPTVVVDGSVVGIWKRKITSRSVGVSVRPFRTFTSAEKLAANRAAETYGRFLGVEATIEL